jgi:hypothetical protein
MVQRYVAKWRAFSWNFVCWCIALDQSSAMWHSMGSWSSAMRHSAVPRFAIDWLGKFETKFKNIRGR